MDTIVIDQDEGNELCTGSSIIADLTMDLGFSETSFQVEV
jgi:hypothetical protein